MNNLKSFQCSKHRIKHLFYMFRVHTKVGAVQRKLRLLITSVTLYCNATTITTSQDL